MFQNNKFRPAYEGASSMGKHNSFGRQNDSVTFSTETNDFNSFSSQRQGAPQRPNRRPPQKKTTVVEINARSLIIAGVAALAAILLIVLVITAISSSGRNITYDDNSYISYKDVTGNYIVSKNGRVLDTAFASEIELIPSTDNSFAYVIADGDAGKDVYLIDGNKPEKICEGAEKILALAELEPGVAFLQRGRTTYYFDGMDSVLTSSDEAATEVVISPDGSSLVYACPSKTNAGTTSLYLYRVDDETPEQISSGKDNMTPVSISNKGKYVLAYALNATDKITKELYVFYNGEKYRLEGIAGSFERITYKNADATEIVFTTSAGTSDNSHSYIYNCSGTSTKKDNVAYDLGAGTSIPQVSDCRIAKLDTLKKTYFRNIDKKCTLYVNNKYEVNIISSFLGQFDPDQKYFYFINEQKSMLCKMEINNGNSEPATQVAYDVVDFYVTQKGNVYYVDSYFDLSFYKLSQKKSVRITGDATDIGFYNYANRLYFEKVDSMDVSAVYITSEGSDHEATKFGKISVTKLPEFTNPHSKKTYAYYEDAQTGATTLFYTSNGKTFKQVAENVIFED